MARTTQKPSSHVTKILVRVNGRKSAAMQNLNTIHCLKEIIFFTRLSFLFNDRFFLPIPSYDHRTTRFFFPQFHIFLRGTYDVCFELRAPTKTCRKKPSSRSDGPPQGPQHFGLLLPRCGRSVDAPEYLVVLTHFSAFR